MTSASGTTPASRAAEGDRAPAEAGWRWPAEWEPHAATWLAWPHAEDTWPGRLARVEAAFAGIAAALAGRERVCVNVLDERVEARARAALRAAGVNAERDVRFFAIPSDDAWIRDHGPIFVTRGPEKAVLDFGFDAWGGKYPPWEQDDAVPRRMAERLGLPRFAADFVLEGGSVDGDGAGTLLTTESCLLHPNRGAGRSRESMERRLAGWLGARAVIWLGGEVAGDDTDGHVDDLARFVAPGVVVAVEEPDPSDPNHAPLAENRRRLRAARDAAGKPLSVAALPMPPPLAVDGERCPASYANFLLANGVALVPVFDAPSDARALSVLAELLEGRELAPIPARDLVVGLGAVHCLTQQEPEVASRAPAPDRSPY